MSDPLGRSTPEEWLRVAREDRATLGRLFARYENYLTLLARVEIGHRLQGKLDAGDLVQDTFLEAHRHFDSFRGTTERAFAAWLRQILAGVLLNTIRRYFGTQARDPNLEQALRAGLDQSSSVLSHLVSADASPSEEASRREQGVLLADAITRLPPHDREVIVLRYLDGLTFPEIAGRVGGSVDRIERSWVRAVGRLRRELEGRHEPGDE